MPSKNLACPVPPTCVTVVVGADLICTGNEHPALFDTDVVPTTPRSTGSIILTKYRWHRDNSVPTERKSNEVAVDPVSSCTPVRLNVAPVVADQRTQADVVKTFDCHDPVVPLKLEPQPKSILKYNTELEFVLIALAVSPGYVSVT